MNNKRAIEVSKKIDAYIRGNLSQREIDELWLLFLENPYYYELFETELHLRNLIQKERHSGGVITKKYDRQKRLIYWTLAAAATVIVVLISQLNFSESQSDLGSLALSKIEYHEMAAGNVERSDDNLIMSVETEMNRAMASAYMLREDEAILMFNELQKTTINESQKGRIDFNLAILHYNRDDYEQARDLFLSTIRSEAVDLIYIERAWWFLANTHLKLNEQTEAMEAILMVQFLDGRNSRSASMLYDALVKRGR